jgi:hypothetical protein
MLVWDGAGGEGFCGGGKLLVRRQHIESLTVRTAGRAFLVDDVCARHFGYIIIFYIISNRLFCSHSSRSLRSRSSLLFLS